MKLKTVGVLCPDCGAEMWVAGFSQQDTWLGYTRQAIHHCHGGFDVPAMRYLLLYDEGKRFVGIVPGGDSFLGSAGNRIHIHDEDIPF